MIPWPPATGCTRDIKSSESIAQRATTTSDKTVTPHLTTHRLKVLEEDGAMKMLGFRRVLAGRPHRITQRGRKEDGQSSCLGGQRPISLDQLSTPGSSEYSERQECLARLTTEADNQPLLVVQDDCTFTRPSFLQLSLDLANLQTCLKECRGVSLEK